MQKTLYKYKFMLQITMLILLVSLCPNLIYSYEFNVLETIKLNKEKEKIEELKNKIKESSKDSNIYINLAALYRSKSISNYNEALKYLMEGLKVNPDDCRIYEGLAETFRAMGSYDEAIKWLKEGFKKCPSSVGIYVWFGRVYISMRKYDDALGWLKRGLRVSPPNVDLYRIIARVYYLSGNYTEAFSWVTKALKICRGFSCNLTNDLLGRILIAMGKYDKAEIVLTETTQRITNSKDKEIDQWTYWGCPYQALGELYSHKGINGEKIKVIENYIKAADLESNDGFSQSEAARICYEYGDYANAMKYIDRAIELGKVNPVSISNYYLLKGYILINMRKYNEAEDIFNKLSADAQYGPQAKVGIGHIEIIRKNYELAKQYFKEMLNIDNNDTMANLGMAWINSNQNEHQKALFYYENILRKKNSYILALLGKGNALMGLKRIDEAGQIFKKVLRIDPENEYALTELGMVAYNKKEDGKAEKLFTDTLKINNSTYTCPYEGLGMLYLKQGKTKEAEESFKKAIQINPDIEYKKYNGLAKIYIKQGKLKEAKELLEKSIQNYPYDSEAKQLLINIEVKK